MSIIRSLMVKVGADVSDLQRKMETATKIMKRSADNMANAGRSLSTSISLPVAAVGGSVLKMAMDAQESENLFTVSMGKMADEARAWSMDMKKSLGLNSYEVRKNVATFNVMLNSMGLGEQAAYDMSKGLTKLSYDMASLYNISTTDAFEKLQSGISGEVEPLKRLGIIVNETTIQQWAMNKGLIKQGQVMNEQQKIIARYGTIMDATKVAQGDLARTMDSPTNKLRIMKGQIQELAIDLGVSLIPVFNSFMDVAKKVLVKVKELVDKFNALPQATKDSIIKFTLLVAAMGPLLIIVSKVISAVGALYKTVSNFIGILSILKKTVGGVAEAFALWRGGAATFGEAMGLVVNPVAAATVAFLALGGGIIYALNKLREYETEAGRFNPNQGAYNRAAKAGISPRLMQSGLVSYDFSDKPGRIGQIDKTVDKSATQKQLDVWKAKTSYLKKQGLQSKETSDATKELEKLFASMTKTTGGAAKGIDTVTSSIRSMVDAIRQQTNSFENFVGLFDTFERKSVSGERLLARLKSQLVAMKEWQSNLAIIKQKGGTDDFVNMLRGMGPGSVDSIKALAGLSAAQIKEYQSIYGQKNQLAAAEASKYVGQNNAAQTRIDKQINLYISGNKISNDSDVDIIANKIIKKLNLVGARP